MGKIIKNGKEYKFGTSVGFQTGGDTIEILTQAEYDELVAAGATDDDIYYFIEDEKNGGVLVNASNVSYDNSESGMAATDVQEAVDEIDEKVDAMQSAVNGISGDITELDQKINKNLSTNSTTIITRNSNATADERCRLYANKNSSTDNPTIAYEYYPAGSTTTEDRVALYFDGTNFYVQGRKDGADSVTKKLGDSVSKITINLKAELQNSGGAITSSTGSIVYTKNSSGGWVLSSSSNSFTVGQWGHNVTVYIGKVSVTSIVVE